MQPMSLDFDAVLQEYGQINAKITADLAVAQATNKALAARVAELEAMIPTDEETQGPGDEPSLEAVD